MGTKYSGPQWRVGTGKRVSHVWDVTNVAFSLAAHPPRKQQGSTQKFKDYCKSEENTAEERGLML